MQKRFKPQIFFFAFTSRPDDIQPSIHWGGGGGSYLLSTKPVGAWSSPINCT